METVIDKKLGGDFSVGTYLYGLFNKEGKFALRRKNVCLIFQSLENGENFLQELPDNIRSILSIRKLEVTWKPENDKELNLFKDGTLII